MTPDCAHEKLLLERRLKYLKLTDVLLRVDELATKEYTGFHQWFLNEELCDVNSRDALIDSLKKIGTARPENQVSPMNAAGEQGWNRISQ
jgi:hypothetical protein